MGQNDRICVLCVGCGCVFCHGFCSDAYLGFETEEIRHVVDCWEYLVPLQVRYILSESLIISFAALQGPLAYAKHLISPARLPFTIAFFGSMGLTLFFSIGVPFLDCGEANDSYILRY
jgi:Got1/Sft2-like family